MLYGQRLEYSGTRYSLRGALQYHTHSGGHYTAVVCRGEQYYACNDSRVTAISRAEAFCCYNEYGSANKVQLLVYAKVRS